MDLRRFTGVGLMACAAASAPAEDRLPTIPPAQYSAEQKRAALDFEAHRKTPVFGPFEPMMHSPEAMSLTRAMGDYFRYRSAIGNPLSELTILITAREWNQDFEWSVHYPLALKAGIEKSVAEAIAAGRRPAAMSADESIVYDYVSELLKTKQVSDAAFERAKARFGAQGVVDLTGIVGYYTFLALQLNAARYRPAGVEVTKLPRLAP